MDMALDGAIRIFRERGFHATSLGELGAAMNLTAGSIYKAFADKRAVFLAAFERYTEIRQASLQRSINAAGSGRDKVLAVLHFYAESAHGVEGERGCLVVGSATDLATFDSEVAGRITAALQRTEKLLADLIRSGHKDGSIPSAVEVASTARLLLSVTQGFRIVGKAGRTRAQMMAAADQAMRLLS
ncbi:TetR/AcrR family transcriptional regulator [Paraburkholderia bryophila]|uniref:TetR/AcrR family transcriptional regulator n=1 Tax=Burkholderiaceae TaxID=119060 RepID=UPI000555C981|nr:MULTISPECIES: TetR/AcrR family transcriptional regulator [Burkholderiaceae]